MLLGLLPASMLLGPLLPYGALMVFITLAFCVVHGVNVFQVSRGSLPVFLSIFGAAAGLWALWWVFLFGPAQIHSRRTLHFAIFISMLGGLAADAYWFPHMLGISDPHWYVRPVWIAVLTGPMILGLKYLILLLRAADDEAGSLQGTTPE
jgi:hypothetical protein